MSATTAAPHSSSSYHNPSDKLEQQAASAALHTSRDTSSSKPSGSSILDEDGRLSSASAALSLRYARPQDLPSFPSTGGVKLASAGAAASLADSNKKSFEHWKPGSIPAANRAANIAKDYEMDPLWKPELTRVGSQAAAAAHRDAAPVDIWKAPESEHGHTAASSALQNQKSPPPITERNVSSEGREKALLAAKKSLSGGRRRAESAPIRPQAPSTPSHAGWAQMAAESSHRGKPSGSPALATSASFDAARIQNMAQNNVSRKMYSANPPVAIEVEERNKQDMLRASAVAMARKMFAIQQEQIDQAKGIHRSESHYAAHTARQRALSDAATKPTTEQELPRYENLEEAARKLAQQRLSKIHDENAEYRQYYGAQTPPKQSRLTLRRNVRRPPSLREDSSDSDEEQSKKIRAQMSIFQSKLAEVDDKKRKADRDALLAAAHKNVTARLNAMDEKVFSETGKTSPHQRELWERQARERAQRESDDRMINVGKVHIGGGKYLEQSEIEAIAKARLQPTLDEISEKAEQQRARDEEIRLEQERIKAEALAEKKRQADLKAEQKAIADREKAETKAQLAEEKRVRQEQEHEERRVRTEQKATEKKARDEAAAAEKERKRAEKGENKQNTPTKSRLPLPSFLSRGAAAGVAGGTAAAAVAETTADGAGGAAKTVAGATPGAGSRAAGDADDDDLAGDTFHDQVTIDPTEAAHVVAATDDEDANKIAEQERDAARLTEDDVGPKDGVAGTTPITGFGQSQEPTSPTSPTSPTKRDSRVKSWFKKLRTSSKAENEIGDKPILSTEAETGRTAEPLKEEDEVEARPSTDSARDVALAGRSDNETDDLYGAGDKSKEGVSPPSDHAPGLGQQIGEQRSRSISPVSSQLSEEPYVIAADVASSRYSAEHTGSKRTSGADQLGGISDSDDEPRGRKGFRERFLKKVIPGRDKDKQKSTTVTEAAPTPAAVAPVSEQPEAAPAKHPEPEKPTTSSEHANPDPAILSETAPLREKVQEPSTTSTEAANTTTTGATTPALTHTATNGDDDDFEEARDTFDADGLGRAPPPTKIIDVSKAQQLKPELVDVVSPTSATTLPKKSSASPVGSRNSGSGGGSRFTEEL